MHLPLHMRFFPFRLALSLPFVLVASTAWADPGADADHFEATMGFFTTAQNHSATGFTSGNGPALARTFAGAPYDRTLGHGLRYDARAVISHVRMTAGFDLPFTSFESAGPMRVEGYDVAPRSLWSWGLRFGLGAEYSFGPVTPFADLQGTVQGVSTTVHVDGSALEYDGRRFGFSARTGVRVHLRRWFFVTASGEVGIVGPTRWGADLGVGFRVGS